MKASRVHGEGVRILSRFLIAALLSMSAPTSAAGPFSYAALGDSLGAGLGARRGYVDRLYQSLKEQRPAASLHNLSSSGATTSDVLRTQVPGLARLRPDLVTLTVGTNDLTEGGSVAGMVRNLGEIVSALEASGAAVVVTNLPAVAWAPAVPDAYRTVIDGEVRKANAAIQKLCTQHHALVFDLYTWSRGDIPRHPEYFSFDGYHPSDDGYERWAQAMWPVVKSALAARR